MAKKILIEVDTKEGPELINLNYIVSVRRSGKATLIEYAVGGMKSKTIRCLEMYGRISARISQAEDKL